MTGDAVELVKRLHREAVAQLRSRGPATAPPPPSSGPAEASPGSLVTAEWHLLRRELDRLLAEGHCGRFALVKAGGPITVWDTLRDAVQAGRLTCGTEPCLVQEIHPTLRPLRIGGHLPCPA